ncbi:FAD-dependent monooxygenase [Mycobacterium sp. NPDC048908]|uniref:FAD-dependent monooxygenase n=1 Tax=Mycobacterium sp. NPDC048908 TaxID=3364292 RepID=UPI00371FB540
MGAGPAGLYFALLMKRAEPSHEVVVCERRSPGYVGGWGVTIWDDSMVELQSNDEVTAARVREAAFEWHGIVVDRAGERVQYEGSCYAIARATMLDILSERATSLGVDIRFDTDVTTAFRDADVVVACDGANSALRERDAQRFGTHVVPGRAKFVWLGTTKVFDPFIFAFVRSQAGWLWFYAYAFDESTSTFIVECTEDTWRGLGLHEASASDSLHVLEQLFADHLDGESLMNTPGREDPMLPWMNFPTVTNERWYCENVVLMGDAAHTTHFSIGSGMRLALQDAACLARKLQTEPTVAEAFAGYDLERRAALIGPQTEARSSQQWFENFERYADLPAAALCALLRARRDPLMMKVSPQLYYRIDTMVNSVGFTRTLRHRVGPRLRTLYGKRTGRKAGMSAS